MAKSGQMGWNKHVRIGSVLLLAVLIFSIAYFSPQTNTRSDPRYSLLVSQALIEHHSIKLDAYRIAIENPGSVEYRIWHKDGHIYYIPPLAASFFAIPLVAILHRLGLDMSVLLNEDFGQNLLSAVTVTFIFIILYKIGRTHLPARWSAFIAGVSVLGTTLMSTIGTAVWSHNFALIFICLSLWLLVRLENDASFRGLPYVLGMFLFLAYFSRPTTAVFIAATLIFLFFRHRRPFWRTAFTAFVCLIGFSLFSQREYGLWLPPYYLPRQLGGLLSYGNEEATPFTIAIYALLFSPSRGLFIYSSFFLLAIGGLLRYWRSVKRQTLFWFVALWGIGQVLFVARFPNWWGGFSFGPRLLTELIPALFLLTVFVIQAWLQDDALRSRQVVLALFLIAAAVSITIHSYVGMFSETMLLSHGHALPPHVDKAPFLLLDWRIPQFLTTPDSACLRNKTYFQTLIAEEVIQFEPYALGQEIQAQVAGNFKQFPAWAWWFPSPKEANPVPVTIFPGQINTYLPLILKPPEIPPQKAVFIGWVSGEHDTWTACRTASIVIGPMTAVTPYEQVALAITGRGHQTQPVLVSINGKSVGQLTFSPAATDATEERLTFPGELLHIDQPNKISLDLPQAFAPESAIERLPLGIFLEKLVIEPSESK